MVPFLIFIISVASGQHISEEQYHGFPQLFHLDDYERCLSKQNGVYCVGTFALTASEDNPTYSLMKAYSEDPSNFNRTRLHRGYCVSERCAPERNSTLRFERCVAKHIQKLSLTARLETAECTTRRQLEAEAEQLPDFGQRLFLNVVLGILLLNVLGTLCEACSESGDKRWRLLRCWSVISSWRKLVSIDSPTKSLAPIYGFRVLGSYIIIAIHVMVALNMMFAYHPHYIEEIMRSNSVRFMSLSILLLHNFAMISSFLTTYFIITMGEEYNISIKYLPMAVLKRVFRMYPTYFLLFGFVTTWWVRLGDGPLWTSTVVSDSETCRNYFWEYAFFVNNYVNSRCLAPSWYLAADFQTNIVVSGLALILPRQGRKAMIIVGAILVTSWAVVSAVVYSKGWEPVIYNSPESHRIVYKDNASYQNLHQSSWIMLPSCFVGMFCAYLYDGLQKDGFNSFNNKWVKATSAMTIPVMFTCFLICMYIDYSPSSILLASILEGTKRSLFSIYSGLALLATFYFKDQIHIKFLSHNSWRFLSRLSLPMMLVHWVVLKTWVGASMYAVSTTYWTIITHWILVVMVSYAISLPIAVLLEIPAQNFLRTLMSRQKLKEKNK